METTAVFNNHILTDQERRQLTIIADVKSKFSTNNFKKIRIPQFSETRFGSFVGLFFLFLCL